MKIEKQFLDNLNEAVEISQHLEKGSVCLEFSKDNVDFKDVRIQSSKIARYGFNSQIVECSDKYIIVIELKIN